MQVGLQNVPGVLRLSSRVCLARIVPAIGRIARSAAMCLIALALFQGAAAAQPFIGADTANQAAHTASTDAATLLGQLKKMLYDTLCRADQREAVEKQVVALNNRINKIARQTALSASARSDLRDARKSLDAIGARLRHCAQMKRRPGGDPPPPAPFIKDPTIGLHPPAEPEIKLPVPPRFCSGADREEWRKDVIVPLIRQARKAAADYQPYIREINRRITLMAAYGGNPQALAYGWALQGIKATAIAERDRYLALAAALQKLFDSTVVERCDGSDEPPVWPPRGNATHRLTKCDSCAALAAELNALIDEYNAGSDDGAIRFKMSELSNRLDDCERTCKPKGLTKRTTGCDACRPKLAELNAAIDEYNRANDPDVLDRIRKLSKELDACEKRCKPRGSITPRITSCKNAECIAIADRLNAAIADYNAGSAEPGLLARIRKLAQELDECEKNCNNRTATLGPVPQYYASTGLGLTTLRTRFDDDFIVDGATGLVTVNGGVTLPVGSGAHFFQFQLGGGIPFSGRSRDVTDTRVDAFFYAEAQGGTIIATAGGAPIRIYAGLGPALTILRIGSTATAWSDTETLPGLSFSAGIEVPLSGRISMFGEARDIYSPFKTFSSPGGNFQAQQNLIMGTAGVRIRF